MMSLTLSRESNYARQKIIEALIRNNFGIDLTSTSTDLQSETIEENMELANVQDDDLSVISSDNSVGDINDNSGEEIIIDRKRKKEIKKNGRKKVRNNLQTEEIMSDSKHNTIDKSKIPISKKNRYKKNA